MELGLVLVCVLSGKQDGLQICAAGKLCMCRVLAESLHVQCMSGDGKYFFSVGGKWLCILVCYQCLTVPRKGFSSFQKNY